MNKLLFTIYLLTAWTGLFAQTNLGSPAIQSPSNKNIKNNNGYQVVDSLISNGITILDGNTGIGTTNPVAKLSVSKGIYTFLVDTNFFNYGDTAQVYGGVFWSKEVGSFNSKVVGLINGFNYNNSDSSDISLEIGQRQQGGAHQAQIEFHTNTATGEGHVHIDVSDSNSAEIQLHIETNDSSIDLTTNGDEMSIYATDSLKFRSGIIYQTGTVFNVGAGTFITNRSTSQGLLHFVEDLDNGTNTIMMRSPAALAASWNLTLPPNDGNANQVLTTDGAGVTTWTTPSGNLLTYINDSTIAYIYSGDTLIIGLSSQIGGLTISGSLVMGDPNGTGNYILNEPNVDGTQILFNNTIVGRFDGSSTAGQTRFMLYDVDNGILERVTVGAADSGGAGFKVLRIPN